MLNSTIETYKEGFTQRVSIGWVPFRPTPVLGCKKFVSEQLNLGVPRSHEPYHLGSYV